MLFSVARVGAANTQSGTNQRAVLDYNTSNDGQRPDFTNFTSLDFNYVSDLAGVLKCKIWLGNNAVVEKTLSDASGFMSFTLANFGGIDPLDIAAMGPLTIQFERSGSNASGSLTITNLVANGASSVPAPGAIALLGAAGLIGARRRRA